MHRFSRFFVDHVVLKQCLFLIFFLYLFDISCGSINKVLHGLKRQQKTNKSKSSQDFSIYLFSHSYRLLIYLLCTKGKQVFLLTIIYGKKKKRNLPTRHYFRTYLLLSVYRNSFYFKYSAHIDNRK